MAKEGIIHHDILKKIIFKCIRDRSTNQLKMLIEAFPKLLEFEGEHGFTPLMYAIKHDHKEAEKVLREAGAKELSVAAKIITVFKFRVESQH